MLPNLSHQGTATNALYLVFEDSMGKAVVRDFSKDPNGHSVDIVH